MSASYSTKLPSFNKFKNNLLNEKNLNIFANVVIVILVLLVITVLFYYFFIWENFVDMAGKIHPDGIMDEEMQIKYQGAPVREMWNMSNITKNESYDIRGENSNTEKINVSNTWNSSYEDNVLNEKVLNK